MRIYFVRHGQTEYNIKELAQGWCDSPLTKLGIKQAESASKVLKDVHFDYVYSSDSGRAVETAKCIIGEQYEIKMDQRLRETNFGDFESKPNVLKNVYLLFHPFSEYRKKNGEKMIDSYQRYMNFINEVYTCYPDSKILIVGHGGVITNFIHINCWKELIKKHILFRFTKNAAIHCIDYDGEVFRIIYINKTGY